MVSEYWAAALWDDTEPDLAQGHHCQTGAVEAGGPSAGGVVTGGVVAGGVVNFTTNAFEPLGLTLAVCDTRASMIPGMLANSRIASVSDARLFRFRDDVMMPSDPVAPSDA